MQIHENRAPFSLINTRASELLISIPASKRMPVPPINEFIDIPLPERSPQSPDEPVAPVPSTSAAPRVALRHEHAPPLRPPSPITRTNELQLEAADNDTITIGKALMDNKEYTRAVHWLKDCKSAKATFLRVYSMYLVSLLSHVLPQTFDDNQAQGEREEGH